VALVALVALAALGAAPDAARAVGAAPEAIRAALLAARAEAEARPDALPVAIHTRNTARQSAPLMTVLAGAWTGGFWTEYSMTHPLFAFEWEDGRLLVVDPGLAPAAAAEFGRPLDWAGGGAICSDPGAWDPLRERADRIRAVLFTHLHVDHVSGVSELCAGSGEDGGAGASPEPLPVLLGAPQRGTDERFERDGLVLLEELATERPGCVRLETPEAWSAERALHAVPGLPGAYRVAVGGHTPGSQLVVAFVRRAESAGGAAGVDAWIVSGDVVNHRRGLTEDLPKPWWYRTLLIPEDSERQAELRALLRELRDDGFAVLVNHHLGPSVRNGLEPMASSACAVGP